MNHYDVSGILPNAEVDARGPAPAVQPSRALPVNSSALPGMNDTTLLTPGLALAFYNAGIARRHLGDLEGAARDFELALRLDPEHRGAQFELRSLRGES